MAAPVMFVWRLAQNYSHSRSTSGAYLPLITTIRKPYAADPAFISIAQKYFDPYRPDSGTEHVALLLYVLTRMLKPKP